MAASRWIRPLTNKVGPVRRPPRRTADRVRFRPIVEPLDGRVLPAVTATFSADGTLRVIGDELDNAITVSRTAAGTILVNDGAIAIQGGTATAANTHLIFLNGGAGNDNLSLNEANGPMPAASISGGDGDDVLTGGSGSDLIAGGVGADTIFMGGGDDTFVWNPGDGSDAVDGQGGRDAMVFNGSDLAERFDLSADGTRARFTRDVGGVAMDLDGVEEIDLSTFGGADTISISDQSATGLNTFNLNLDGAAGLGVGDNEADAVIINGTDANDVGQIRSIGTRVDATISAIPFVHITGEGGLDSLTVDLRGGSDVLDASDLAATNASQLLKLTVTGGAGDDTLTGSQGADSFVWNPGDGDDTIDGGVGEDTLVVNGSDLAEQFDLSANGVQGRLTRNLDAVTVDFANVEEVNLNPLGGADTVTVNELTATPVTEIRLNLAGSAGGPGDNRADAVIVNGTDGADVIPILGNFTPDGGVVLVDGGGTFPGRLPYFLAISATEGGFDTLTVNARGGNDTVNASGLFATNANQVIRLTVNGGTGNDAIVGSPGQDTFVWNAGDGSDTIDGGDGLDLVALKGAGAADNFVIGRNGTHGFVTLGGGSTLDLAAVDGIDVTPLGGADVVTVNDLTGTGIIKVQMNLSADGQADNVILNGTADADAVVLTGGNGIVLADGLFPLVRITGPDGPTDHLTINTLGGFDTVDATNLPAGLIGLTVNLGGDQPASPRVAGVDINGGAVQRSMVTQIRVAFDQHVTLPANRADAFRLVRQSDGAIVTLAAAADDSGSGTVVTLTVTGGPVEGMSLADGRYTLTVLAGQVGTATGLLDGDANGLGGDDFVLAGNPANRLFRLFGDATGNGVVDLADLAAFRGTFNASTGNPAFLDFLDADHNGVVDLLDLAQFRSRFNVSLF